MAKGNVCVCGGGRWSEMWVCVRQLNYMMLENHTPSVWAFFLSACVTYTNIHTGMDIVCSKRLEHREIRRGSRKAQIGCNERSGHEADFTVYLLCSLCCIAFFCFLCILYGRDITMRIQGWLFVKGIYQTATLKSCHYLKYETFNTMCLF